MKPSETSSGRAWLTNFSEPDVPTATILLDSLRFVTLSVLRNGLQALLEALAASGELRQPALVLPERSMSALSVPPNQRTSTVAYRDFHPGAPLSPTPGSDGFVGMILRDFARAGAATRSPGWIAPDATIDDLRARRCRSVVIVTDYVGSGNQVSLLAEAIARNPTIRSWRSLHLTTINVLAFAASPGGLSALESSRGIDRAWSIEAALTFEEAPWTRDVYEAIVELCATKARRGMPPLGYRETGGLFVTERNAPNNLPAIFWQSGRGWRPLFPKRTIPPAFAQELSEYRLTESLAELAQRVGQLRLGRNERLSYLRPASEKLLQALVLIARRVRPSAALAAELAIELSEAKALVASLHQLGLLDSKSRLTTAGRRELDAQKRRLRKTTANLEGSDAAYYPLTLK